MSRNIKQYNIEAIKSIYKEDLSGVDSHNDEYVLNNYFNNHIYYNATEFPDKIVGKNGIHTFSSKRDNYTNINSDVTYTKINSNNIITKNYIYKDNQIISYQDIDWDNAYLKYLDPNFINSNKPFIYDRIDVSNGQIQIVEADVKEDEENYTFNDPDNDIPKSQYIKNTDDLIKVISYLLQKYERLKKLMAIIREQFQKTSQLVNTAQDQNNS